MDKLWTFARLDWRRTLLWSVFYLWAPVVAIAWGTDRWSPEIWRSLGLLLPIVVGLVAAVRAGWFFAMYSAGGSIPERYAVFRKRDFPQGR